MRAKEAAVWLGVPLRSLHHYVRQGLLPSYKLGRHRLFRKAELLSALDADRTASSQRDLALIISLFMQLSKTPPSACQA